jgi:hypothetical protein
MSTFFVPYHGNKPAPIDIKGHRLLILSTSSEEVEESLPLLGADEIRPVELVDDGGSALAELAARVDGGVVITPPGMTVSAMLLSLERELPWLH